MKNMGWMTGVVILGTIVAGLVSPLAAADQTVTLPYMQPDKDGNQWMVHYYGYLQQQGNMPVYSSTGVLSINGNSSSGRMQRQARIDGKTGELVLDNLTVSNFQIVRRFQFNKDDGYVRIIDVIRNTQNRDAQAQITFNANANYGITAGQPFADPKKKGQNLGVVATTSANGRVMVEMYNGPGVKTPMTVDYQPNNNNVTATLTINVPASKEIALMHVHAVHANANDATEFFKKFNVSKALRDVPSSLRKILVNFTGGSVTFGDFEVLRGEHFDIVEMRTGDQFRGTLKEEKYRITTFYGPMELPASRVNGIVSIGAIRPRQLLFTAEGDILGGFLDRDKVTLQLSDGQSMDVPLAQVARIGYRKRPGEPDEIPADKPFVLMRTGERISIQPLTEPFTVHTRFGVMKLKPELIAQISFQNDEHAVHEVRMLDGTRLVALVESSTLDARLAASDQAIKFPMTTAARLVLKPDSGETAGSDDTAPQLKLTNEELLVGTLTGKLQLDTGFSMLTLDGEGIRALARVKESPQDIQVTLWDETSFKGQLQDPQVRCVTKGGLEVKVPITLIDEYTNAQPRPSNQMVTQVKELVNQLNADDFKTRQQAQDKLTSMGTMVISVLRDARAGASEEAQSRIDQILAAIEKKK